jgi:hypothetical protein
MIRDHVGHRRRYRVNSVIVKRTEELFYLTLVSSMHKAIYRAFSVIERLPLSVRPMFLGLGVESRVVTAGSKKSEIEE